MTEYNAVSPTGGSISSSGLSSSTIYQPGHDVTPIAAADLKLRIEKIRTIITASPISELFNKSFWRHWTVAEMSAWHKSLQTIEQELSGAQTALNGLQRYMPVINEKPEIPSVLKSCQSLQMTLFLMVKKCKEMMRIFQYTNLEKELAWYKEAVAKCTEIATQCDTKKLDDLCDGPKGIAMHISGEKSQSSELPKALWLRMKLLQRDACIIALKAKKEITEEVTAPSYVMADALRNETTNKLTNVENKLNGCLQEITQEIAEMTKKAHFQEEQVPVEYVRQPSRTTATLLYSCYNEYWKTTKSNNYWYPTSWNIGLTMDEVQKDILGLKSKIEKCFEEGTSFDAMIKLRDEYKNAFLTLRDIDLKKLLDGMDKVALNDKFIAFIPDYAAGLMETFNDTRRALKLLYLLTQEKYRPVLDAQHHVISYLNSTGKPSDTDTERSLKEVEILYSAPEKHAEILITRPPKPHFADRFMDNANETRKEIFAQRTKTGIGQKEGPKTLDLTKNEERVWEAIIGRENIASQRYTGESNEGLPTVVRAHIEKRMAALMLLRAEKQDLELEILLYVLGSHPGYSLNFEYSKRHHQSFTKIYDEYLKQVNRHLSIDQLRAAGDIFFFINKASQNDKRDPLFYLHACQALSEFIVDIGATAATGEVARMARKKLKELAESKKYPLIPEDIAEKALDVLVNLEIPSLTAKNLYTLEKQQGILWRALGSVIWGRDDIEKDHAQHIISTYVEDTRFNEIVDGTQLDLLLMIYENTVRKILRGQLSSVKKNELRCLIEGPIEKHIVAKAPKESNPNSRVAAAIPPKPEIDEYALNYVLIQLVWDELGNPIDNRPITTKLIDMWGATEFVAWKLRAEQFLEGVEPSKDDNRQ